MTMAISLVMCVNSVIHIHFDSHHYTHTHKHTSLSYPPAAHFPHPSTRPAEPCALMFASSEKHINVTNKVANWVEPVLSLPNVYLAFT